MIVHHTGIDRVLPYPRTASIAKSCVSYYGDTFLVPVMYKARLLSFHFLYYPISSGLVFAWTNRVCLLACLFQRLDVANMEVS